MKGKRKTQQRRTRRSRKKSFRKKTRTRMGARRRTNKRKRRTNKRNMRGGMQGALQTRWLGHPAEPPQKREINSLPLPWRMGKPPPEPLPPAPSKPAESESEVMGRKWTRPDPRGKPHKTYSLEPAGKGKNPNPPREYMSYTQKAEVLEHLGRRLQDDQDERLKEAFDELSRMVDGTGSENTQLRNEIEAEIGRIDAENTSEKLQGLGPDYSTLSPVRRLIHNLNVTVRDTVGDLSGLLNQIREGQTKASEQPPPSPEPEV